MFWGRLADGAKELGLSSIRLDVNAPFLQEGYHASWEQPGRAPAEEELWQTAIPLTARGHVVGRLKVCGVCGLRKVSARVAVVAQMANEIEVALADYVRRQLTAAGPARATVPVEAEAEADLAAPARGDSRRRTHPMPLPGMSRAQV